MSDTKNKILDTAERLIAEQGYAATSLRHIIAEAGVNLASIHYHFGSKEELLEGMIARKADPINAERIVRLERLEQEVGAGPIPVVGVISAFLGPVVEEADRHPSFVAAMGRLIGEGFLPAIVERHFRSVSARTLAVLRRATPQISDDEFAWRKHFMFGAMAHTMCSTLQLPSMGLPDSDFRTRLERLITFVTAGFEAPATETKRNEEQ